MRKHTAFVVEPGATVFLHQAFKCCPFAGMVTSQIHDYIERNGGVVVEDPASATVQVVNTCGSDQRQAQLTFDAIERIRSEAPGTPIVVTGCMNSIEPKKVAKALEGVVDTAMFDPHNLSGLDDVFAPTTVRIDDVRTSLKNSYAGTEFSDHWYHVGASTGCFGTCTFCAIRRATGRPRSNPIEGVLADVRRGIAAGHRDVLIVSTDLSAWGADLGLTVVDLVRALVAMPEPVLFSAEAFEPTLFLRHFDELVPLFESGRFVFIGLPIQSGSQRILDQMHRFHDIRAVLDAVGVLRERVPQLVVRTDILYGFGDETDDDFTASREAGRHFGVVSYNAYQERPGTPPVQLGSDVFARRRGEVMEELRFLAARRESGIQRASTAPGEVADVWNVEDGASADDGVVAEAPVPVELQRWAGVVHAYFDKLVRQKGPVALGRSSWRLSGAEVHEEGKAVALLVSDPQGGVIRVGLRRADQPGATMARSDRFAMWILAHEFRATKEQDEALSALQKLLGLTHVRR